ncbi:MAG: hypothetical protein KKA79_01515, partial [Nanoarchaeota archaeon]|nr:hypothetical protein [Nanoarchaeota archaeon]
MLVLISFVSGSNSCPSDADFEDAIRQAIVDYFDNPNDENLNTLRDLVRFYSTNDLSSADCSEVGDDSGVEIQEIYNDVENVTYDNEDIDLVVEDSSRKDVALVSEIFSWVDDLLHSEWISNGLIGITLHSWGSDDFQFPIGSNNLWVTGGTRFAVKYNDNTKWSHNGWIGNVDTFSVTDNLDFVENTN